jgi:predicted alpha/beta-fold hydrolase
LPLLPRIQVPALVLTARDDPFVCADSFDTFTVPPGMEVWVLERGGHLGFLGWNGKAGIRWAELRLVEWVLRQARLAGRSEPA